MVASKGACIPALAGLALLVLPARSLASREWDVLEGSCEVLDALAAVPMKSIPPALMRDAQGVAIFPGVLKAGLMVGGRYGRGVLVLREPGGAWGKPVFITITGGGVGWQLGIQSTDLVLVFKTRTSLDRILKAQVKVTLGADVAVAAGPIGRQAEAATDAQLRAEIYSYSRSRGLFLGVSVEGAAIVADTSATDAYYRTPPVFIPDPRTGAMVPVMPPEEKLRLKLASWCASAPPAVVVPAPAPTPPASPR